MELVEELLCPHGVPLQGRPSSGVHVHELVVDACSFCGHRLVTLIRVSQSSEDEFSHSSLNLIDFFCLPSEQLRRRDFPAVPASASVVHGS